ncbi:hypothetical protein CVT24_010710 [Panaeolus cyanescens]|uniref:Uncharacterized protein n=1 Tax=Panaeolus cyanescens TaxID=181874 RepID=A0A409YVX1_9AGAR|nr:hypothetical protein CVT24_010710 [Panaeolus cyanescens]
MLAPRNHPDFVSQTLTRPKSGSNCAHFYLLTAQVFYRVDSNKLWYFSTGDLNSFIPSYDVDLSLYRYLLTGGFKPILAYAVLSSTSRTSRYWSSPPSHLTHFALSFNISIAVTNSMQKLREHAYRSVIHHLGTWTLAV